jgi:hexokinase
MVVNMESGTYNGFPQGDFDLELDRASMSPGTFGNEKMVGGVYQGEVLLRTLRGASQTLFSPDAAARISCVQQLTAADLSAFLESTGKSGILSQLCATEDDRNVMKVLVTALLERAAKLVTLILAGPMEAENMGVNAPALIVAEGSTFWKNRTLHQMIEAQANLFLKDHLGRSFVFFGGEQLNLYGAAAAAFRT